MSLTIMLVIITVVISLYANNSHDLKLKLSHTPFRVKSYGEYYRLLSSGFIHADLNHLFFNMFALYMFGSNVERYFELNFGPNGRIYFVLLYFSGIIVANLQDFFQKSKKPYYSSLGASGGVSSIVFSSILIKPLSEIWFMPAYLFSILYLAYSFYMDRRQGDNVNHMAHFWGGVWGFVFTYLLFPEIFPYFVEQITSSF